MSSHTASHDVWFKMGLAIAAFAISMMFASLLMPADDAPMKAVAADVLGP